MKIKIVESSELSAKSLRAEDYVDKKDAPIVEEKLARFMAYWKASIHEEHAAGNYAWPIEQLDTVLARMEKALRENAFEQSGPAIKSACARLCIPNTRTAIRAYLRTP